MIDNFGNNQNHKFLTTVLLLACLALVFILLNTNQKRGSSFLIKSKFQDQEDKKLKRSELIRLINQAVQNAFLNEKKRNGGDEVLNNRELLVNLLKKFRFKTMIEIGVKEGQFATIILSKWPKFGHYYGIDAWQTQTNYKDGANVEQTEQDKRYNMTLTSLTNQFGKERITILRKFSTQAVSYFRNESIDFIYVDARHDYCGCTEDMINYFPILKCGGLFAGHDFQYESGLPGDDWAICGNGTRVPGSVKKAVLDFAEQREIARVFNTGENSFSSWYFFKACD